MEDHRRQREPETRITDSDGNWRGGEGKESKERTQAEPIQGQEH
jgi:hypothetical protein